MRLYFLSDTYDREFARPSRRGTWYPKDIGGACPECTGSLQRRIPPLVVEWEPGSIRIPDFMWPGLLDDIIVTERVRQSFLAHGIRGAEYLPVEMLQDPKLKRPTRKNRGTKPRIWLPYEGEPLWDLWVTATCVLDGTNAQMKLMRECQTCGLRRYDQDSGFEIDPTSWHGEHIFHFLDGRYLFTWNCVTEDMVDLIKECGFTNVTFKEAGVLRA